MSRYRHQLPHLAPGRPFIAEGGLETTLVFQVGLALPCFAASAEGRARLARYCEPYLNLAAAHGTGLIRDTPTWRANADWGARLGYDAAALSRVNRAAVSDLVSLRATRDGMGCPLVINGVIGPRGDGYRVEAAMTAGEASAYHAPQIRDFHDSKADMVSALTLTYAEEAIGVAKAARAHGMPVVLSFTVETDGRLPSGQTLARAIAQTDAATGAYPVYYMINCAHPSHVAPALDAGAGWLDRIGGLRADASMRSHAELDEATELDIGDPQDLARRYAALRLDLKHLRVLGGCCGTDHRHIGAICEACL